MKKGSFVYKLAEILRDPVNHHLIRWNGHGNRFVVYNTEEFSKNVLPRYFKHSNWTSFVRQLHLYGFHKASNFASGTHEFANPHFIRGREDLIQKISRRVPGKAQKAQKTAAEIPVEDCPLFPSAGSSTLIESLKKQVDELKEENRMLVEDNQKMKLQMETYSGYEYGSSPSMMPDLPEIFFEAGNFVEPEKSPLSLPPASEYDDKMMVDLPQLVRHASFDSLENYGSAMLLDSMDDLDYSYSDLFHSEAGEPAYDISDMDPNGFFDVSFQRPVDHFGYGF